MKKVIKEWPDLKKAREQLTTHEVTRSDFSSFSSLSSHLDGHKYYIRTYGCQANIRDEESIKGILEVLGMIETNDINESDLIILNTCAIRENAENKVYGELGEIKHLKQKNKNLLVAMCGCMIQQPEILDRLLTTFPFIDIVFGTSNIHDLPSLLDETINNHKAIVKVSSGAGKIVEDVPCKRNSKKQAFVNIMYGCDKYCAYCIVPFTRGRQRSRKKEDILKEVNELVKEGYLEITLLGQNVNAYGKDLPTPDSFASLLEEVAKTNIPRLRFITSHPWDFDEALIKVIKDNPNITRFLHLPIQSGSNKVLKDMGRRYTYEDYKKIYNAIKKEIPDMAFSTDIIVGYPTESYEEFKETLKMVEELEFSQYFTFIFSPRIGTYAASLTPVASDQEHKKWFKELTDLCAKKLKTQNDNSIGTIIEVLVEGVSKKDPQMLTGYTKENTTIHFKGDPSIINTIVKVKVIKSQSFNIIGEIVND